MTAIKTRFDGNQIIVPRELDGAAAQDVLVVVGDEPSAGVVPQLLTTSIFDIPRVDGPGRSADEIVAQVRSERDAWGER